MKKLRIPVFDSHMREILGKGSVSVALKFVGTGLNFLLQIFLARLLGAEGVGVYFVALALATTTALIARLGMDYNITRVVAGSTNDRQWRDARIDFQQALKIGLTGSVFGASILIASAGWLSSSVFSNAELTAPLRLIAIAVAPMAMTILYSRALQGQKRVAEAMLVEVIITPLVACTLAYWFVTNFEIAGAAIAFGIGSTIALITAAWRWHGQFRDQPLVRASTRSDNRLKLIRDSAPLFGTAIFQQLGQVTPLFVLGAYGASAEAGVYYAAYRTAALIGLLLIAANGIIAPKFAALFENRQTTSLNNVVCNSAFVLTVVAMPALLLFLLMPGTALKLFGDEFVQGAGLLRILACGQLINIMTGSLGFLLIMTDNARAMFVTTSGMLIANVVMSYYLIPIHGSVGAAVATAGSLAIAGVLRFVFVWRDLGILALPILRKDTANVGKLR